MHIYKQTRYIFSNFSEPVTPSRQRKYIFLVNPINTRIESPSHLIEIPSDRVCPVIKNGSLKGNYLLFSTLFFVCKLDPRWTDRAEDRD